MTKVHRELYIFRAIAIIAMVLYHGQLVNEYISTGELNGRWYSYPIAMSFMFLSGVSLSLIQNKDEEARKKIYKRAMVRLSISALLVTLVTYLVIPEFVIVFGILHLILFSYFIFYVREQGSRYFVPGILIIVVSLLDLIRINYLMSSNSLDHTPIYKFLIIILIGYVVGRHLYGKGQYYSVISENLITKGFSYIGKYTLLIYLVHMPILYILIGGPNPL